MIKLKNIGSSTVIVVLPDLRFRRELKPGREIPITDEEYENMTFDTGVNTLVRNHFIQFSGVDEDKQMIDADEKVYDAATIRKMLETQDITSFAKFIPTAAPAEKDTVVKLAVELGVTNSGFVTLIKKYCDVDVISAINTQHLVNE